MAPPIVDAAKAALDLKAAHPGLSPDFLMYMQMQQSKDDRNEQIRKEDMARMEADRKEDRDRSDKERYSQQKMHEQQILLLTQQLAAAKVTSVSTRSTSKMPLFDIEKDHENFPIWLTRWKLHIQGHGLTSIANLEEKRTRILMELTASLSDSTLAWIASKGFEDGDLENYKFLLQAMEDKILCESNNPFKKISCI